jgi:excisionase family DNA binding protein
MQSLLSASEASTVLGVSREFLMNLLERGEIAYREVGTHRRVCMRDLLEYKGRRDRERGKILDDLSRAEAEEGLYGLHAPECLDC